MRPKQRVKHIEIKIKSSSFATKSNSNSKENSISTSLSPSSSLSNTIEDDKIIAYIFLYLIAINSITDHMYIHL